jgi:hypothetical protein
LNISPCAGESQRTCEVEVVEKEKRTTQPISQDTTTEIEVSQRCALSQHSRKRHRSRDREEDHRGPTSARTDE